MKKFLLIFCLMGALAITPKAHAIDAKGKAFLVICTYGTVGGALLGFATMAFGSSSRAIAQGASLGLYAGIGFGSYVIASHNTGGEVMEDPAYQQPQQPPPPGFGQPGFNNNLNPPVPGEDGGFGAPAPEEDSGGGFFGQRVQEINDDLMYNYQLKNKKGRGFSLPIYVPLLNVKF